MKECWDGYEIFIKVKLPRLTTKEHVPKDLSDF